MITKSNRWRRSFQLPQGLLFPMLANGAASNHRRAKSRVLRALKPEVSDGVLYRLDQLTHRTHRRWSAVAGCHGRKDAAGKLSFELGNRPSAFSEFPGLRERTHADKGAPGTKINRNHLNFSPFGADHVSENDQNAGWPGDAAEQGATSPQIVSTFLHFRVNVNAIQRS